MKIYCAGPLGFAASSRGYHHQVLEALGRAGVQPLDPWDPATDESRALLAALTAPLGADRLTALRQANLDLGTRNRQLIESADGVLAILDGADVDSGTAAEIGFAAALGIPVVGLRTDLRQTGEEGSPVNLQIDYFVHATGGRVLVDTSGDALATLGIAITTLTGLVTDRQPGSSRRRGP